MENELIEPDKNENQLNDRDWLKLWGLFFGTSAASKFLTACQSLPRQLGPEEALGIPPQHRFPTPAETLSKWGTQALHIIERADGRPNLMLLKFSVNNLGYVGKDENPPVGKLSQELQALLTTPAAANTNKVDQPTTEYEVAFDLELIRKQFSDIIFMSHAETGKDGESIGQKAWPGSPRHLEIHMNLREAISKDLSEPEQEMAYELLISLIHNREIDQKEVDDEVSKIFERYVSNDLEQLSLFQKEISTYRNEISFIPDNIPLEEMSDLWLANAYMQQMSEEERKKLIKLAKLTECQYGIWVPSSHSVFPKKFFANDKQHEKAIKQWKTDREKFKKEHFLEIPKRPRVFLVETEVTKALSWHKELVEEMKKIHGPKVENWKVWQLVIIHPQGSSVQPNRVFRLIGEGNRIEDWLGKDSLTKTEDNERNFVITALQKAQPISTVFDKISKSFGEEKQVKRIYEIAPSYLEAYLEPQKIRGTKPDGHSPQRLVWGLKQKGKNIHPLERRLLSFGEGELDLVFPDRKDIQTDPFSWFRRNHWRTHVTEIVKMAEAAGIKILSMYHLMSPAAYFLNNTMRGLEFGDSPPNRQVNVLHPKIRQIFDSWLMLLARNDAQAKKDISSASILEVLGPKEIPVWEVSSEIPSMTSGLIRVALLGPILTVHTDLLRPETTYYAKPLTDENGEAVNIVPGDSLLTDGGIVLFKSSEKDDPGKWMLTIRTQAVENERWDTDGFKTYAISLEDALNSIAVFDPDDHYRQALDIAVKVVGTIAVFKWLGANPAQAGKLLAEFIKLMNFRRNKFIPVLIKAFQGEIKRGANVAKNAIDVLRRIYIEP